MDDDSARRRRPPTDAGPVAAGTGTGAAAGAGTEAFPGRALLGRALRRLWDMLTTAGVMYIYAYYIPEPTDGPAPLHPERVRPEIPLTAAERALADQLRGVGRTLR